MDLARIEQTIGRLDRRIVYLGLLVLTLLPLVFRWSLPLYVTDPARKLHATIEALPTDKVVILSSDWDAGSQAESRPQLVSVARHLIRRGIKFAVISIGYPTSPQLSQEAIQSAIRLEGAESRFRYGTEWVNLGYKFPDDPWLRSFTNDLSGAVKEDWEAKPLTQFPMMEGVRKFGPDGQISMLMNITGQATIDLWYQYLTPSGVKIGLGATAVMAPEQYPFLDSGQLSGLLTGMKGAAEYEQIIKAPGSGMPAMAGQSFAHLYILILIVLGNISVLLGWLGRRRAR